MSSSLRDWKNWNRYVVYKALATTAQTLVFASTLSLVVSNQSPSSDLKSWKPTESVKTTVSPLTENNESSLISLPSDPFTLLLVFSIAPATAIVMSWIAPEWALLITVRAININKGSADFLERQRQFVDSVENDKQSLEQMLEAQKELLREKLQSEQQAIQEQLAELNGKSTQLNNELDQYL